ncbi:MAG: hypothetical protein AAB552_01065 [Patescibacteria group bacterium]
MRSKKSLWWFTISLIVLWVTNVQAKESTCSLGLGAGYVKISTSVLKLTNLEKKLAKSDDVNYSRSVDNESTAHELSIDCLLGNNFGIRGSYIDGLEFSATNTITSPKFFLESPIDEIDGITIQSLKAKVTRKISGSATGVFVYYRFDVVPSFATVSVEGGSYYVRAESYWKASLENVDGEKYFTLLGETEYQREYFPSIAFSGNLNFTPSMGLSAHYMPVPGKTTRMLFLTFTWRLWRL